MSIQRGILLAAGTIDGTGPAADLSGTPWITVYLKGDGGTISSGVITLEEADYRDDQTVPTDWSSIGTINANTVSGSVKQLATHIAVGAYAKIRARVSTPIGGGGTVTLSILGVGA